MQITIDHITIDVAEGMTVMQAAEQAGISIPSMCYLPGHSNHPSCMVCLVKDLDKGGMFPSCAMSVQEGMHLSASSEEVMEARKEALELLLSDHVGDCEAPCRLSCPAFMNIPLMNRLIAEDKVEEALHLVREEIALPLVLGYICPAPCEKACRRKSIDQPVSICLLKRYTAMDENIRKTGLEPHLHKSGKRVAVIGTGPAGLSAAYYTLKMGHDCTLFDKQEKAGGALRYSIPDDLLPKEMLDADIESIRMLGGEFRLNYPITAEVWEKEILTGFDAVILATGFREENSADAFNLPLLETGSVIHKKNFTSGIPGVFGCGSIISEQLLAVRSAAQGKKAAMEADAFIKVETELRRKPLFNSAFGPLKEEEKKEYMQEATSAGRTDPKAGYLNGFTKEEAIREAERCMHCDCRKPVSCKLRIFADEYGANRRRFAATERNLLTRNMQHEMVVYEPEKCIRCGLCIEIATKEGESLGLAFVGRGFDVRVTVPFGKSMKEGLERAAQACVEGCPTGALASGPADEWTSGPADQRTSGQVNKRTSGPADQLRKVIRSGSQEVRRSGGQEIREGNNSE
ncbi:2Fe-2S iron-sulfur cluster-binding protein [Bacteroidota bacterium]